MLICVLKRVANILMCFGKAEIWNFGKSLKSQISKINILPAGFQIEHPSNILTLGSCFSDSIGSLFERFKFNTSTNPFGTLVNPISTARLVSDALSKSINEEHLIQHDGLWKSLDYHSQLCNPSKVELLSQIQILQEGLNKQIKSYEVVFISLGSAVVYRYLKTNEIISNNQRLATSHFEQELLKIENIRTSLDLLIKTLKEANPRVQIVLTLSPVRHLKKGAVLNQRSKARLLEGIHQVIADGVHYFPAYELMLDELRDYRYYHEDLVHPSNQAVDHIWDALSDYCFSENTKILLPEIEDVLKMLGHRPQHPEAHSSLEFQKKCRDKIYSLMRRYPHLNFK